MGQVSDYYEKVTIFNSSMLQGLTKKNFTKKQQELFSEVFLFFDKNNDGQV